MHVAGGGRVGLSRKASGAITGSVVRLPGPDGTGLDVSAGLQQRQAYALRRRT